MVDDVNDDKFDAQPEMSARMATSVLKSTKSGPTLNSKKICIDYVRCLEYHATIPLCK